MKRIDDRQLGFAWAGAFGSTRRCCAHCGEVFEAVDPPVGRKILFCGEECREAAKAAQRRRWEDEVGRSADRRSSLVCVVCGDAFAAEAKPGRLPLMCSDACRRKRQAAPRAGG